MTSSAFDLVTPVLMLDRVVDQRLGGVSVFNGTVHVFDSGRPSGIADWDGTVRLRRDVADRIEDLWRGRVADPDAVVAALEVVVHELAHLRGLPGGDPESARDAFAARPSTRALDEAVTQLWARRHTPELVTLAGLDRLDPRVRAGAARTIVHVDLVPGIEILLAGVARRIGSGGEDLLTHCCRANAAQKWPALTDWVFTRGGLAGLTPESRHDAVRAALERRLRMWFETDPKQPTLAGTLSRSGLAGAQALASVDLRRQALAEEAMLENSAGAELAVAADLHRACGHHLVAQADLEPDRRRRSVLAAEARETIGLRQLAAGAAVRALAEYRLVEHDLDAEEIKRQATECVDERRRWLRNGSLDDGTVERLLRQAERFVVIGAEAEMERLNIEALCHRQLALAAELSRDGEQNSEHSGKDDLTPAGLRRLGRELLRTAHRYESVPGVEPNVAFVARARSDAAARSVGQGSSISRSV